MNTYAFSKQSRACGFRAKFTDGSVAPNTVNSKNPSTRKTEHTSIQQSETQ